MKLSCLIVLLFLINAAVCQQRASSDTLSKYAYPVYFNFKGTSARTLATCFFVNIRGVAFIVTAGHTVFEPGGRKIDFEAINIYNNPKDRLDHGFAFSSDELAFYLVIAKSAYCDIAVAKINIPKGQTVNFAYSDGLSEYSLKDTAANTPMVILGYPNDDIDKVPTAIYKWNSSAPYFFSKKYSSPGSSGGPVFVFSKRKDVTQAVLAGINTGRDPKTDKGVVQKFQALYDFVLTQYF